MSDKVEVTKGFLSTLVYSPTEQVLIHIEIKELKSTIKSIFRYIKTGQVLGKDRVYTGISSVDHGITINFPFPEYISAPPTYKFDSLNYTNTPGGYGPNQVYKYLPTFDVHVFKRL